MKRNSQNASEAAKIGIRILDLLLIRIMVPSTQNSVTARKKVQSSTQIARLRKRVRIPYKTQDTFSRLDAKVERRQ